MIKKNTPTNFTHVLTQCLVLLSISGAAIAADVKLTLDGACAPPEYPRASLSNEEKGTVSLRIVVGVDGKPVEAKVEKGSGFRNLDRAAREAFEKCKFKPGTKDGKPEQQTGLISFEFKLE